MVSSTFWNSRFGFNPTWNIPHGIRADSKKEMKPIRLSLIAGGGIVAALALFLALSLTSTPSNIHHSAPAGEDVIGATADLDFVKAFLAKYPNAVVSVSNQYGPYTAVLYSVNSTVIGGGSLKSSQYSTLMLVIPMNSSLRQVDKIRLVCTTTAGISSMGALYWQAYYKNNQSLVPFETALDRQRCLK
ncbi:MAG: hypothetical protein KGI27_11075 [Thaumarchaeota archaeon]|nr:hypothetical protein [Nitrososphaerota archaeon]